LWVKVPQPHLEHLALLLRQPPLVNHGASSGTCVWFRLRSESRHSLDR
jgi:hypothetical protein